MSRTDLLELWPDGSGSDEALTQAVSALRRALGDTKKPHQLLHTVPKFGYRLVTAEAGAVCNREVDEGEVPSPVRALKLVLDRPLTTLVVAFGLAGIMVAATAGVSSLIDRPNVDIVVTVPQKSPHE